MHLCSTTCDLQSSNTFPFRRAQPSYAAKTNTDVSTSIPLTHLHPLAERNPEAPARARLDAMQHPTSFKLQYEPVCIRRECCDPNLFRHQCRSSTKVVPCVTVIWFQPVIKDPWIAPHWLSILRKYAQSPAARLYVTTRSVFGQSPLMCSKGPSYTARFVKDSRAGWLWLSMWRLQFLSLGLLGVHWFLGYVFVS